MADEKPFYASERLSCMLTGMFVQDNMDDLESMLRVDGRWIMTEIPKKTREIIAQLEIPIIQN